MEQKIETKKNSNLPIILGVIVLVIVVGLGYWLMKRSPTQVAPVKTPEETRPIETFIPEEDSVSAINEDLEGIQVPNLDQALQEIDQDLNSL